MRRALHSRYHDGIKPLNYDTAISISELVKPSHAFFGLYQFPYVSHQEEDCEATTQSPGDSCLERTSSLFEESGSPGSATGLAEDKSRDFMESDKEFLFHNSWDDQMLTIDPNLASIGSEVW
jgi:hypothetical protein